MTRGQLFGVVFAALAASGCGLKGPLYLPDKSEVTIRPAPTQAAPEAPEGPAAPEAAGEPPAEPEQTPGPEQPPQDPPRDPVRG